MNWRYLTKRQAGPMANPGFINEDGAKVFKSKVAKSWCAIPPSGKVKTGFSCAELAKQYIERVHYGETRDGLPR